MATIANTTVSACTAPAVHGGHLFVVADYSLNKGIGIGNYIRSKTFRVGDFDWSIRYYPDGFSHRSRKFISVFVELMTANAQLRAKISIRLVGKSPNIEWKSTVGPCMLNSEGTGGACYLGWDKFIERTTLQLEESEFLVFDRLLINCQIAILEAPLVSDAGMAPQNIVPPSQLSNDFLKLLESKEGADITFFVKGEAFPAHRIVLASRSPVFKAELYGSMMEKDASHITVEDMEPTVFRALLHFVYSESLIPLNDFDARDRIELIQHLLGAADRYALERLKIICAVELCGSLHLETVINTLSLADQHQCKNLKDACLQFIASPGMVEKVMATQEYNRLKRKCPALLLDVMESVSKFPKI